MYLAVRIQRMADVAGFVYHRMERPRFGLSIGFVINIPKVPRGRLDVVVVHRRGYVAVKEALLGYDALDG